MDKKKTVYFACAGALLAIAVLLACLSCRAGGSGGRSEGASAGLSGFPVYISEIMSSNGSYYDGQGNTYDWIELYNSSEAAISLTGYKLTDNERTVRYVFPAGASIDAHGYYVVHCKRNEPDYADFSISKTGGEPIVLMNSRSVTVDRAVTLPLMQDQAMARRADGSWETLDFGTPGYENSRAGYEAYCAAQRGGASVRINELMSSNESYCCPATGLATDWIELYNTGDAPVELAGCRLADRSNADGLVFQPGTTLGAGEYLLIWCGDAPMGDTPIGDTPDAGLCAPFSLASAGGESLTLASADGHVLDQLLTPALGQDVSYARDAEGGWAICAQPTPGYENSAEGYRHYLDALDTAGSALRISEIMASNASCRRDAFGEFSDWIELYNAGDEPLALHGYSLSDNPDNPGKWMLPDIILPAHARLVVCASGRDTVENGEPHTNFSLNRHKGTVCLRAPNGQTLGSVVYEGLEDDMCYRLSEAGGVWEKSDFATPGFSNDDAGYAAFMDALLAPGPLVINEVMPGNSTLLEQGNGLYFDWIELKNISSEPVKTAGYRLSDNLNSAAFAELPDKTLAPGGRLMLMCTDGALARCDYTQISLTLSAAGDRLYLIEPGGAVVDSMRLYDVPFGGSCGRMPAQNGQFYFLTPTPDRENTDGRRLISAMPEAGMPSGVYEGAEGLTLSLSAPGTIHYTLDCSTPTSRSPVYTGPIPITRTTIVRAAALEDGKHQSGTLTLHYIVNEGHTLPVVSVVTDDKYLYDARLGIFAGVNLFDRTVERPASIAYFNGGEQFLTNCGLKLHGAGSRGRLEKKSFKITFRPRYGGLAPLEFPLFEENDTTTFHSILLRNGQDYSRAYVRDELVSWFAYRDSTELLVQDTRYCVLYLNGGYYGIYCIKEAFSSGFFSVHYGVDKESVEVQRGYIKDGTAFKALIDYAYAHDLRQPEYYNYVRDQVNLESLIDWCVYEAYTGNGDISVNARYLRSTEYDDNRWHYSLFDMDFGFSGPATFQYVFGDVNHGVLPARLSKNKDFQELFLTRMAYLLKNSLQPDAIEARYDALIAEIEGEIPREKTRWHVRQSLNWDGHQQTLQKYMRMDRAQQLKESIAAYFNIPLSTVESYF